MLDYKELAKMAASSFIHNNEPLNKTITKIAQDNDLNPEQIARVCEISNKTIHNYCLLKVADKNFTFALADASTVAGMINNNNDAGLTSSFEPKLLKESSYGAADIFGEADNSFSILKDKQDKDIFNTKIAAAIQEVESRITTEQIKLAEEVQDLKTQVEQLLAYGIKPEDVRQLLVSADPHHSEEVNKLIAAVSPKVVSGTPAVPAEEYKTYINPSHPVVIQVKNIFAKYDTIQNLGNAKNYLEQQHVA